MLLDALEEARAQIDAIFEALALVASDERIRLYQNVGIGRHVRHIVDHFNALKDRKQIANGEAKTSPLSIIDYNQRSRDSDIERDFERGQSIVKALSHLPAALDPASLNQPVQVRAEISGTHTENGEFQSTLAREILYLINHTIHHAAYIKLLLRGESLLLPAHIGIAPCTASFLRNKAS
jgi:uncharacterized damage-inducible protein DinB